MFWLIFFILLLLILCTWLESDIRQENIRLAKLVKESKQKDDVYKPTTRPWFG